LRKKTGATCGNSAKKKAKQVVIYNNRFEKLNLFVL
jgi:hypothetical protein